LQGLAVAVAIADFSTLLPFCLVAFLVALSPPPSASYIVATSALPTITTNTTLHPVSQFTQSQALISKKSTLSS